MRPKTTSSGCWRPSRSALGEYRASSLATRPRYPRTLAQKARLMVHGTIVADPPPILGRLAFAHFAYRDTNDTTG